MILGVAGGSPYFLHEYGQANWNLAPEEVFTGDDARAAVVLGLE